jgi:hypothetical protein
MPGGARPWQAIAAAVFRTDDERAAWHPRSASTSRPPSRERASRDRNGAAVQPGADADLVLLGADPSTRTRRCARCLSATVSADG